MAKEKTGIIFIALKLFIICFVSTLILAFVNNLTKDTIKEYNEKVFSESCLEVVPGGKTIEIIDFSQYLEGAEAALVKNENEETIGIAVKRSIKGYNSGLVLMTGVSIDGRTVKGIKILDHSETPGLGALADRKEFTGQFKDKTYPLATKKDGGEIVAISGATKTTKGIIDAGVNTTAAAAEKYFAENPAATEEMKEDVEGEGETENETFERQS